LLHVILASCLLFIVSSSLVHVDLPPFPTRRSSDLELGAHALIPIGLILVLRPGAASGFAHAPVDQRHALGAERMADRIRVEIAQDQKSTRLNSSHVSISYAVFCLKKKIANITSKHK